MARRRNVQVPKAPTITEMVRTQLEHEIRSGFYLPGDHLEEVAISARLDCSRTPVREALNQLVAMGLVVRRTHCGVYVGGGRLDRPQDSIEAFAELEALIITMVINRISLEDRANFAARQLKPEALIAEARTRWANPVLEHGLEIMKTQLDPRVRHLVSASGQAALEVAEALLGGQVEQARKLILSQVPAAIELMRLVRDEATQRRQNLNLAGR